MPNRLLVCLSLLLLVSCNKKIHKSQTTKSTEIYGPGVLHIPVVADLSVRPAKVSYTVDDKGRSLTIDQLKEMATGAVLQQQKADVLVEPHFSLERKRRVNTLTVTGWPADYTNFRNMDTNDVKLFEAGPLHPVQTKSALSEIQKPRRPIGGIVAIALTGVLLLVALTLPIY